MAALGLSLSGIEYATRGHHKLGPLIIALAAVTLVNGFVTVTTGLEQVFAKMETPGVFDNVSTWRSFLTTGFRQAIGSFMVAGSLAASQLLAWAVARRRVLRS